ncbi:hypothetical protein AN189_05900 [Loktanella sp. 3ANDIMAR09]|nr:hypothetical protein AN189_05900 [Loktanella sp. 3ANDIMAR09]
MGSNWTMDRDFQFFCHHWRVKFGSVVAACETLCFQCFCADFYANAARGPRIVSHFVAERRRPVAAKRP